MPLKVMSPRGSYVIYTATDVPPKSNNYFYFLWALLASFGICNALGNKQTDFERRNAIDSQAYERTVKEEIHNILEISKGRDD